MIRSKQYNSTWRTTYLNEAAINSKSTLQFFPVTSNNTNGRTLSIYLSLGPSSILPQDLSAALLLSYEENIEEKESLPSFIGKYFWRYSLNIFIFQFHGRTLSSWPTYWWNQDILLFLNFENLQDSMYTFRFHSCFLFFYSGETQLLVSEVWWDSQADENKINRKDL